MALATLAMSLPAAAQLETLQTPEITRSNRLALEAFECAILATHGSVAMHAKAPLLSAFGASEGRVGAEAMGDALAGASDDALGAMTPFLRHAGPDFMLGMALSTARTRIEAWLDRTAPFTETQPLASSIANRRATSDEEYARRSCDDFLR